MPRGAYLLSGTEGAYALERFSCAPGPAGWRYVAAREDPRSGAPLGRLDVVLDASGRAVRVLVQSAGWEVRGGVVGGECLWRRGTAEHTERAAGFTGSSPAWAVATARLLGARTEAVRVRLVRLGDEALSALAVEERWRGPAPAGDGVDRWEVGDLETGEAREVHLAGDVLVDAPGVRLLELDGPPTLTRP